MSGATRAQQLLRWATVPEQVGRKVGRGCCNDYQFNSYFHNACT